MASRRFVTITGIILVSTATILLSGFFFSILKTGGFWLLPQFGMLGMIVFLQSFPWLPLTVLVLLVILLSSLLMQLAAARHLSFVRTTFELLALFLLTGCLLSFTPFYRRWRPPTPPENDFGLLMRGYGAWRFHNIFRGTVLSTDAQGYVIRNPDGFTFTMQLMPGTRFPTGRGIAPGDAILIIGELRSGTIRAFGIRKL